ncbi:MAG: hypothetical protein PHQ94_05795 [Syntrophomonas sp.]|nr:hypothetical protein [Syntrophomonas sp.]
MKRNYFLLNILMLVFLFALPRIGTASEAQWQIKWEFTPAVNLLAVADLVTVLPIEVIILGLLILLLSPLVVFIYMLHRIKKVERLVEEEYAAEVREFMQNEAAQTNDEHRPD